MHNIVLGRTGINVSRLAFGAGPIPQLMTDDDDGAQQRVVDCAVAAGVNWFDTAATYGDGSSERHLGVALEAHRSAVSIATKVRLFPDQLNDVRGAVRASVEASLKRLRISQLTLLQLHNSITAKRGDQPTSLEPADVLGEVSDEFRRLQDEHLVRFVGLTGIGDADSLAQTIDSGRFDTIQIPFNLANPSAGSAAPNGYSEADYGNVIARCAEQRMGVLAIRVFAGGALLGLPPSPHTHKTKFFPIDLYRRDVTRGARLAERLPADMTIREAAVRFPLTHPHVHAAIVGFSDPTHVTGTVTHARAGRLSSELYERLLEESYGV
ncbi:MAG: aldo/keto reductase [Pirellulaceae bacterium]|jgi:L-galactose dehydrogenase/L-glyceraldehyde 3-phosphate reductase|nr:aldo/keto reductase [Pirellulaceae bacterium]MDP7020127.1 aldo/keto reductase [Pirellulaceae bacterium]